MLSDKIYVPDNKPYEEGLKRTTHLAISAHQDDIEMMAIDGILQCFGKDNKWFSAVVVTDGAGSPRNGLYADFTDEQMRKVRKLEQKKAAVVGEYSALALLDYSSADVKDPNNCNITAEIKKLIEISRPSVIYTHNLADRHDTHVATSLKVISALRELPQDMLPEKFYGCEVWRSLDWVNDDDKVVFNVSSHPNIASALVGVFDSQIAGGKRYDLAAAGRRTSNATYYESHGTDGVNALSYAIDLMPLARNKSIDISKYITDYIDRFKNDVTGRLKRYFF